MLSSHYSVSRTSLHVVGTHVVARARHVATGRFGLRVTPGGFGTPEFGEQQVRLRVDGATLLWESGASGTTSTRTFDLDGADLHQLAAALGLRLDEPFSAGHDTPPVPAPGALLRVDPGDAEALGAWLDLGARALARAAAQFRPEHTPTMAQLWPEHFDLAFDTSYPNAASPGHRVNLGCSAGDAGNEQPYLYVGPWTADRPGDAAYWNASFGSVASYADVVGASDPLQAAVAFFDTGMALLSGS